MGINSLDYDRDPITQENNSYLVIPYGSQIDSLQRGSSGFTAEGWIWIADAPNLPGRLWDKANDGQNAGWSLQIAQTYIQGYVDAWSYFFGHGSNFSWTWDYNDYKEQWLHMAITFNYYTDAQIHFFLDGELITPTTSQSANMLPLAETGIDLWIGCDIDVYFPCIEGYLGWQRVSNTVRYTTDFTPPPRCVLPSIDAYTKGQWIGAERVGAVTTVDNQEGNSAYDGIPHLLESVDMCPLVGTFTSRVLLGEM